MLLLFLVNSTITFAQNPYIKTNSGIGQYGYLEKDATTTMLLNSNSQSNIYQLFARTWLNSNNLFTYGFALNDCTATTNLDQNINNYNFGANAIAGLIAYTSVHADYCGGSNSYGGNSSQTGYNERQHYLFDLSDRPSDVTSSVIQLNPGVITSPYNVVMSVKIDFGSVSSRVLQRFWIQNTGTLAENSEIANDGFKIYYEPATGSETFNGTESNATIYGDYNSNPTNNNLYGHDALNIAVPAGGLRVYVVLNKFAACLSTAKTVQVSLINDGLSFSPAMDTSFTLARVGQTPAAPATINVAFAAATTGALNGTYYIPSACFPTVATAVTALNTYGVAGPVIFNVLAGYSETTPSGGFNITGTGTAVNTITFQKFSTGTNPIFTAFTPQATTYSRYGDGIFRIVGGDYITIDSFTMLENNSNTTTGASNNMTEFGVGLFYTTATNGAQNNTIKNCTIDLDKTYTNTIGVYSNSSHTAIALTSVANATSAAGSNSNLTITGNSITDVNSGIVVVGSATAAAQNDGLVIGGTLANANTITNYGTGSFTTTFYLVTSTVNGIVVRNTKNYNVSYNSLTSSTVTTVTTIRGIYVDDYSAAPTGTITNSVNNNTISVRSAHTSGDIFGIQLNGSTGSNVTTTTSISNNDFSNFGYTANSSGAVTFIYYNQTALNLNINSNTFTNNTVNTSGSVVFIRNYSTVPSAGSQNVNSNRIVTAFTKSVANGALMFYDSGTLGNSHITALINQNSNNFSNVTVSGTSAITGWYNFDGGGTTTSKKFQNNTFSNISGGSGAVVVMDIDVGNNDLDTNTISNVSGSGSVIGIRLSSNSGTNKANANPISGLLSNTTTADVVAIWVGGGATQTITNNVISTLTSYTNAGSFKGIYLASPGSGTNTVTGNFISGMINSSAGTSSAVRGIHVASGSNSVNISSNEIYDLSGATTNSGIGVSSAIVGILISTSTATSHAINLNKIYNLNATTTSANSISVAAIATGGVSTGGTMSRNRIYGLTNTATGIFPNDPFIVGFWPTGGSWTFANNMISLSNGANTNGMQCIGVYDSPTTSTAHIRNYYYNSITIGGSSTGTQNSVALQYNSRTGPTANIYNNILDMTRTGSGKNYALANLTVGLATMNCNYNILNATNSATVVATNGITDNTFTQWQATGKDANSLTEGVLPFVDIPTADLHMNATCSSAEGAAIPLASPNIIDYDNEARDATYPDIGADEFSTRTSIWNGTAWSTWNGVSFSSAIPTGNTNLEFTGSYSSPASLEGCACTVTSGNVVFNSSHTLTLLKKLTVAASPASMTFENNSSLVQINNVTNTGNITYKRTTTPYERYDYIYWSKPVADARALSTIFSGWRTDYSFTFNTQNFADLITAATGIAPADSFDDNGDAWVYAGPSATMTTGKGYAVMAPTSVTFSPQALPTTVSFFGVPNNGVIPVRIYESANAASTTDDFNLVGNPYPSAILADKFITDNGVKTSGTLYFWTHVADVSVSNPGPSVSNFVTADYALYNLSGGTRASLTGSTVPTGKVASGQGFFIEAQANNVDIVFNNSMRDKTYLNNDFFKTSNTTSEIERDRLWLNLQNPDGLFSQLLLGYFEQTTLGFDWAYDGRVNTSNTQLTFYSLAQNEKYKIQARPSFTDADKVPLGYFSIANGQFTISLGEKEGVFDTDQNVYLEDRDMNIIHDLKQSPYTFTTNYGKYENRFILRYTNEALGTPDFGTLNTSVVVSANHGEMNIKSYIENIQEVTVYDVLGRQLFFAKAISNNNFVTSNITMSQQTLIVKIKLENGLTITRKIIL